MTDTRNNQMICTVTTAPMFGTVIRWYFSDDPMAGNPAIEPAVSVSRRGVRIGAYLHQVPYLALEHAKSLHETLKKDPDVDCTAVATHRHVDDLDGPLVPINDKARRTDEARRIGGNSGHGHAWERPDRHRARCGGPSRCSDCSYDQQLVHDAREDAQ